MTTAVPRVARVHITTADNDAARPGLYQSIAAADEMLADAYAKIPAPEGRPYHLITYSVIWTDGLRLDERLFVTRKLVEESVVDRGLLRHGLMRRARTYASGVAFRGFAFDKIDALKAEGRDLLRRLELDALGVPWPRNASGWRGPTLLPRPRDAIRRLRERFAHRSTSQSVPATNNADVRYLVNFISIALGNDLSAFEPATAAAIWNHWRTIVGDVERAMLTDADSDAYPANENLWRVQLPSFVHLLDEAVENDGMLRNGRLVFRGVGRRGEPYPDWVQDLRDRSGVYVIRERLPDGSTPIVYVGESHADRLHETLTRHFQTWRRWKGFWRGQFSEGHDPGLTYDRDKSEAAAVISSRKHAIELETRFIRRLRPRDNLMGQEEASDVPF